MENVFQAERKYTAIPNLDLFYMHTHDCYEIFGFLAGNAKYYVEGTVYQLRPGDILLIKKAEAHSLLINEDTPYERIVVNFAPDDLLENGSGHLEFLNKKPLGKNNQYPSSVFNQTNWLFYLNRIVDSTDLYEKRMYLTVLMCEMEKEYHRVTETERANDVISDVISFINAHLTEPLSLGVLCEKFYISKSQLNRRFRSITGSTVWEYIVTKRLLFAKELLQNGIHPTDVYLQSGFRDYCSFYRGYKTKFGVSPKCDLKKEG